MGVPGMGLLIGCEEAASDIETFLKPLVSFNSNRSFVHAPVLACMSS